MSYMHSETSSMLSYTLRYVSFGEVGRVYRVVLRKPMDQSLSGFVPRTDTPVYMGE
jgi:hypothetical protein